MRRRRGSSGKLRQSNCSHATHHKQHSTPQHNTEHNCTAVRSSAVLNFYGRGAALLWLDRLRRVPLRRPGRVSCMRSQRDSWFCWSVLAASRAVRFEWHSLWKCELDCGCPSRFGLVPSTEFRHTSILIEAVHGSRSHCAVCSERKCARTLRKGKRHSESSESC